MENCLPGFSVKAQTGVALQGDKEQVAKIQTLIDSLCVK